MKKINYKKGFTLTELIVGLAIFSLITIAMSTYQRDVFYFNSTIQSGLRVQLDARHVVKTMVSELRKTTTSATGSFSVESAATTSLVFYSDINSDGKIDRVRYFLSGSVLKKGVVVPTGTPYTYNLGSEVVTNLVSNIVSSSTLPIFQYYPSSYDGTTQPLTYPINISTIRLVRVNVIIDTDPNRSPTPMIVTSTVSLRNLKDNL